MSEYVIVGAGSAGCVLAARLSEAGAGVTLLEAGGSDERTEIRVPAAFSKLFRSDADWDYWTEPQEQLDGREIYWPRGKVLGGSSSINAQMVVPGNRADFDEWERLGCPGWGYDDVLPYFRRSEERIPGVALRSPNPLTHAFCAAAAEVGLQPCANFGLPAPEGVGQTQVWQRRGRRWSSVDGYLRPALKRPNLRVVTNAQATRVLLDGTRATGVAYRDASGEEQTATCEREVILCGGTVNSPQLLLLSGIGPARQLAAHGIDVCVDLPGVGRNLQDHLSSGIWVASRKPITLLRAESKANVLRWLVAGRGMLTSNVAEALAFVRTRDDLEAPDLELVFAPVLFVGQGLEQPTEHGFTIGGVLLRPRSTGSIELRSGDPLAAPVIQPNYLADPEDVHVLVTGIRLARRIAAASPFAKLAGAELGPGADAQSDDALEAWIRDKAQTLYHPVGTCRMGTDPLAVVDPQLRVRGVDGLRVVDASVMPTLVRGHTNAATVMIAEKAADAIRTGPTTAHAVVDVHA